MNIAEYDSNEKTESNQHKIVENQKIKKKISCKKTHLATFGAI